MDPTLGLGQFVQAIRSKGTQSGVDPTLGLGQFVQAKGTQSGVEPTLGLGQFVQSGVDPSLGLGQFVQAFRSIICKTFKPPEAMSRIVITRFLLFFLNTTPSGLFSVNAAQCSLTSS